MSRGWDDQASAPLDQLDQWQLTPAQPSVMIVKFGELVFCSCATISAIGDPAGSRSRGFEGFNAFEARTGLSSFRSVVGLRRCHDYGA